MESQNNILYKEIFDNNVYLDLFLIECTKNEAENILRTATVGNCLVRKSSKYGYYKLSYIKQINGSIKNTDNIENIETVKHTESTKHTERTKHTESTKHTKSTKHTESILLNPTVSFHHECFSILNDNDNEIGDYVINQNKEKFKDICNYINHLHLRMVDIKYLDLYICLAPKRRYTCIKLYGSSIETPSIAEARLGASGEDS